MDVLVREEVRMDTRKSPEEEKLETVDLSGLSLDSIPNPSINVASIFKLDLSNNNLVVPFSLLIFIQFKKKKKNGFLFYLSSRWGSSKIKIEKFLFNQNRPFLHL